MYDYVLLLEAGGPDTNDLVHLRDGLDAPDVQFHFLPGRFLTEGLVPGDGHGFSLVAGVRMAAEICATGPLAGLATENDRGAGLGLGRRRPGPRAAARDDDLPPRRHVSHG
jgi:hypothetical protein